MESKKKHCCKCYSECVSPKKIKDYNSNINITYAPKQCTLIAKDDDELRLRIWSFMRPPKISTPTPIISPCRLEKVRNLLNVKQNLKLTKLDCIGMPKICEQIVEQTKLDRTELESAKNRSCRRIVHGSHRSRKLRPCITNYTKDKAEICVDDDY